MAVGSMGLAVLESGAPITAAAVLTPSDTVTQTCGRMFLAIVTSGGNAVVVLYDGTQITVPLTTGLTLLPWAVQQVMVTNTTATATYYNLR